MLGKFVLIIITFNFYFFVNVSANSKDTASINPYQTHQLSPADNKNMALKAISFFTTEQIDSLVNMFSPELRSDKVQRQLHSALKSITSNYGNIVKISERNEIKVDDKYYNIVNNVVFERDSISISVTIDNDNIVNFFLNPAIIDYEDADYVTLNNFTRIPVVITMDSIIEGEMAMPTTADKNTTCVILVHGSGPNDMDETIGLNKPFRDIAYGLASSGIAVLRYDKRTLVDKNIDANKITLTEETVNDAVAAANYVRNNFKQVSNIIIAGHSLGGYALPKIAADCPNADGFISLAGSVRSLPHLIKEQLNYLIKYNGDFYSKSDIDDMKNSIKQCERCIKGRYTQNTPTDSLPLGINANYLLDLQNYNPANEFVTEKRPILILHCERDYQVNSNELAEWKKKLGRKKNVTFISVPGVNHIFQFGENRSLPTDYNEKVNVDYSVIAAIKNWLAVNY